MQLESRNFVFSRFKRSRTWIRRFWKTTLWLGRGAKKLHFDSEKSFFADYRFSKSSKPPPQKSAQNSSTIRQKSPPKKKKLPRIGDNRKMTTKVLLNPEVLTSDPRDSHLNRLLFPSSARNRRSFRAVAPGSRDIRDNSLWLGIYTFALGPSKSSEMAAIW